MKQEVRSAAKAERGVEEREGMDKSSRKVGEWRSYGNTAGFLGIMDLLEDSDRELRVRPENMPDVSSSPGHPQSRQSPGFTQSCGLGWQSKRGEGKWACITWGSDYDWLWNLSYLRRKGCDGWGTGRGEKNRINRTIGPVGIKDCWEDWFMIKSRKTQWWVAILMADMLENVSYFSTVVMNYSLWEGRGAERFPWF